MKNFLPISNVILAIAVVILFILYFNSGDEIIKSENQLPKSEQLNQNNGERVRIAYINTDTLLVKYNLSKDLNEELLKKQEDARTNLNEEARTLDSEMREFQRKIQNNGFLTRERAQSEQQRLLDKEQKLKDLNTKLSNDIVSRQQEISNQLLDTITNYLDEMNLEKKYDLILSTTVGGNILYAKKGMDITNEVLKELNQRYSK